MKEAYIIVFHQHTDDESKYVVPRVFLDDKKADEEAHRLINLGKELDKLYSLDGEGDQKRVHELESNEDVYYSNEEYEIMTMDVVE